MAYNNDNLAVAIHDTDNIITEENIEECVVDYWTQRVKDFSDVREHELNSDMGKEWLEEIISNISMYTAYDKKSGMSSGTDVTENSRIKVLDVGTGVGYFAILLNRCGMDVTGIDLTPDMITRAKELADKYGVEVLLMTGFLDGINDSLKTPNPIETMEEDTEVSLDFDKEKLYYNMVGCKADWLYELPQWDNLLDEETRKALYKKQKLSGTVVKGKKIGRNDPCPCGSGKKYKQCCGKNA